MRIPDPLVYDYEAVDAAIEEALEHARPLESWVQKTSQNQKAHRAVYDVLYHLRHAQEALEALPDAMRSQE